MGVGVFALQHAFVERLGAFGEADEAVALRYLEADAVAFVLVAAHLAVGFLVAVGGFGVLFASEGQVGVLGGVSSLCVEVAAHEDEQCRHQNQEVSFHKHKFSLLQTQNGRFYFIGQKYEKWA